MCSVPVSLTSVLPWQCAKALTKSVAKLHQCTAVAVLSASVAAVGCVDGAALELCLKLLAFVHNRLDRLDTRSGSRLLQAQSENGMLLDQPTGRDMVQLVVGAGSGLTAGQMCCAVKSAAMLSFAMADLDLLALVKAAVEKVWWEGLGLHSHAAQPHPDRHTCFASLTSSLYPPSKSAVLLGLSSSKSVHPQFGWQRR